MIKLYYYMFNQSKKIKYNYYVYHHQKYDNKHLSKIKWILLYYVKHKLNKKVLVKRN